MFIHGELETRIKRIQEKYDLTHDKAREMIIKKDKQRTNYYNYYSSKKWGLAESYHLTIDSGLLGIDGTAGVIAQFVYEFEKRQENK